MSRSKFKGPFPYITPKTLQQPTKKNSLLPRYSVSRRIQQVDRTNMIQPKDLGKTFAIHNGRVWIRISVNEDMLRFKFGSFIFNRPIYKFKKKKK